MAFLTRVDASAQGTDAKEALQALQDYIGGWKGNGTSEKDRSEIWKESANWSGVSKGKDASLTVEIKDSKLSKRRNAFSAGQGEVPTYPG